MKPSLAIQHSPRCDRRDASQAELNGTGLSLF
jgi:hypothetical protein